MRGFLGVFGRVFECFIGLGRFGWIFLRSFFQSKAAVAAKIVALESQLDACLRAREGKRFSRFSDSFRFLWVILSIFWDGWERMCHAMKPRTVVGWKDWVIRRYWRWKSRGQVGRKAITVELRKLIRRISRENPLWGAAKIRDVLVDLGFRRLDVGTVRKYMPRRPYPKDPSGNWLSFIHNHMGVSWAMDFCVVRTIGFRVLYVFVILEHGRRRIRHWNVTESPTLDWIIQQLREATAFGEVPVIIINEQHLRDLVGQYVNWYENYRFHQGLEGKPPISQKEDEEGSAAGKIISISVLGGLHHRYERVAA